MPAPTRNTERWNFSGVNCNSPSSASLTLSIVRDSTLRQPLGVRSSTVLPVFTALIMSDKRLVVASSMVAARLSVGPFGFCKIASRTTFIGPCKTPLASASGTVRDTILNLLPGGNKTSASRIASL